LGQGVPGPLVRALDNLVNRGRGTKVLGTGLPGLPRPTRPKSTVKNNAPPSNNRSQLPQFPFCLPQIVEWPLCLSIVTTSGTADLADAVYAYEGYIDKFIGDSVMAVFGALIAHEDDPERALRAALAMRERLEAYNRRWIHRLGQPLALHIGINTGLVIAGNVGSDLRLSNTVMGDTVNTASRLENAAQAGQIRSELAGDDRSW
jgi:class 3 adenylate cyclase